MYILIFYFRRLVKTETKVESQEMFVTSSYTCMNATSDICAPPLQPNSHDHSYQLTLKRFIEEHKIYFLFCYSQHKL